VQAGADGRRLRVNQRRNEAVEVRHVPDEASLQAVVAAFQTAEGASNALDQLKSVWHDVVALKEAAVVVRGADGNLQIKESHHVALGAVVGAIVGAVVGLIVAPVGPAAAGPVAAGGAAAGGAAIGALANRMRDTGLPDERLNRIGQALTPGTSVLVAIVESQSVTELERKLRMAAADVNIETVRIDLASEEEEQAEQE